MGVMTYTVETIATVDDDHNLVLNLPDVPPGRVRITVQSSSRSEGLTGADLVASEFFGDLLDEDGWPDTPEAFIRWRRMLWERPKD